MTFLGYEWFNDLHLLPYYLLGLVGYLFILIVAIVFHELGHMMYFKINKIEYKSRWLFFKEGSWIANHMTADINNKEHMYALVFGLVIGLLPIIASSFVFFPAILLVVPYGYIIRHDLKEMMEKIEMDEE